MDQDGTSRATSRRSLLRLSALAGVLGPATLAACARKQPGGTGALSKTLQIASPSHPVLWPIAAGNAPIASGLSPEKDATLQLYNYADYIAPDAIKAFEKKYRQYNVKVKVSTFNDSNEALAKIRAGSVPFDIYFPSYDQIGKLATTGLIRPLNHSYIPGITNVWSQFQNPFYDQQWRYSIPYTVYTTGIAWRTDKVSEDLSARPNPWDVFWDPKYAGRMAVLDDYRETISMALLKEGGTDVNTTSEAALTKAQSDLLAMTKSGHPSVTIQGYSDLPGGRYDIAHVWSGDAVNMQYYLPKGTSADVLRYWYPQNGHGLVNNDLVTIMTSSKAPVLAHLFLDHLLQPDTALQNLGEIGYQPPQNTLTAAKLVETGYVPKALAATTTVEPTSFQAGYRTLELAPAVDAEWEAVWQRFKAGG